MIIFIFAIKEISTKILNGQYVIENANDLMETLVYASMCTYLNICP